jgi:16S rRNA (adenine1518-N6/adenine1519-N6)-dimethyltransferase
MNVENVKILLKKYGIRPLKSLGQNFLVNERVFDRIIRTAELSNNDIVLEIGPGIGNLTLRLGEKAQKIIAIEKDKKMCEILKRVLENQNVKNIKIIEQDALKLDFSQYTQKPYKLIANLPYYITSPVIRKFLELKKPPESMILMVQKEVAQRICANPPKLSLLAISVQFYAKPKIISYVSKKSFWPRPKVDSAIIKIVPFKVRWSKEYTEKFFKIVKVGFSHPRKQLINNLSKGLNFKKPKIEKWLLKNKIQPSQRAETLSVKYWQKLTKTYSKI